MKNEEGFNWHTHVHVDGGHKNSGKVTKIWALDKNGEVVQSASPFLKEMGLELGLGHYYSLSANIGMQFQCKYRK